MGDSSAGAKPLCLFGASSSGTSLKGDLRGPLSSFLPSWAVDLLLGLPWRQGRACAANAEAGNLVLSRRSCHANAKTHPATQKRGPQRPKKITSTLHRCPRLNFHYFGTGCKKSTIELSRSLLSKIFPKPSKPPKTSKPKQKEARQPRSLQLSQVSPWGLELSQAVYYPKP